MKSMAIVIFIGTVFLAAGISNAVVVGRSVTMNLAFKLGPSPESDDLNSSSQFASEYYRGTVVALASTKKSFGGIVNNAYSPDENMISLVQPVSGNEFFISFTEGNSSDIENKISHSGNGMISTTFGNLFSPTPESFPLNIVAEYFDIYIANSTSFSGTGQLVFRNLGSTPSGEPVVGVEKTG